MAFVVILFALGEINTVLSSHNAYTPPVPAKPKHAAVKLVAPPKIPTKFVVENTTNGFVWWLDSTGSPFTHATAVKFLMGHPTYHVYVLKIDP